MVTTDNTVCSLLTVYVPGINVLKLELTTPQIQSIFMDIYAEDTWTQRPCSNVKKEYMYHIMEDSTLIKRQPNVFPRKLEECGVVPHRVKEEANNIKCFPLEHDARVSVVEVSFTTRLLESIIKETYTPGPLHELELSNLKVEPIVPSGMHNGKTRGISNKTARKGGSLQCSYCEKSSRNHCALVQHERIHTGEKPFKCAFCEKSFSHSGGLKHHERAHTGEKPFACSFCGKSFSHSGHLKTHERIHTGEKPFGCSFCEKRFRLSSGVKRHERSHTGEKPFSCRSCGKSFRKSCSLRDHERTHTGEKPFQCAYCGKCFGRSWSCREHVHNIHYKTPR